ncbi:MAG: alpha/beta hydrolase [Pseudomonadota bacterium]
MMARDRETVTLPSGRRVTYAVFGAPAAMKQSRVVLAFHGTPGSRLKFRPADEDARRRNCTLLAVDRWGYGGTDAPAARSGRTLARFAADMKALLDELGIETVACVGISGGGPYATAVGAQLKDRVQRLALVAPVGIIRERDANGRERTVPLSAFHKLCFRGVGRAPPITRGVFAAYKGLLAASGKAAIGTAMARSGPADRRLLDDPAVVTNLVDMMREGLAPGANGPAIDLAVFSQCWDVDPAGVTAQTRLWFGDQDGSVPESGIVRLSERIPGSSIERLQGQGHFWIATRFPEVLDWLGYPDADNRRLRVNA